MKMSIGVSVTGGALRNILIDLLQAMGMSDEDCNVEEFITLLEEDQGNVIMTLHWVINEKTTLTLSHVISRWKKCYVGDSAT